MLSVQNLVKQFGSFRAVDGVSFDVEKGTVLGFLGPNGAGKSTTMRMITGYLPPTSGTAVICGDDIVAQPIAARRHIGYLPENAPSYAEMTVQEFLKFTGTLRGYTGSERRDRVDRAVERCFLQGVRHQTIDTLSKGYRQRTCFAQAILHDPPVLIMDEPTDGLDPNQKKVVREMILEMSAEKVIILSTHVLEEVEAMCNRVLVIDQGLVAADGTVDSLKSEHGCDTMQELFHKLTTTADAKAEAAA